MTASTSVKQPRRGFRHVRDFGDIKVGRRYRIVYRHHPDDVVRVLSKLRPGNVRGTPMILVEVLKGTLKGEMTSIYLEQVGVVPYGFPHPEYPLQWNQDNWMLRAWPIVI